MTKNPERRAWLILLAAFALCCAIIVAVPLSIRAHLMGAVRERDVTVESLSGTVVIDAPVGAGPRPLSQGESDTISPGTTIRVDESSEAVVQLFDHSFMRLYGGTTIKLERAESPRYGASPLPNAVRLSLVGGRVQIGTAISLDTPLDFQVSTLQANTTLNADGSYAIEVSNDRTEVVCYRGEAQVEALDETVELVGRARTAVSFGSAPEPASDIARNLIVNGDFVDAFEPAWRLFNDQGADGGEVDGTIEMVVDQGLRAARFARSGADGNHCETILEQTIDQPVPDPLTSLKVRATVKVRYQGLSGGGYLSSEYPLMIRITYRDVYDSEAEWIAGFYYENDSGNPTTYGISIPRDSWYAYESDNLLENLPIRPYRIVRVRVYGSGWDYESLISDINLIVE